MTLEPPHILSNSMVFGRIYTVPQIIIQGEKKIATYYEMQVVGFETITVPAGTFKDCLRVEDKFVCPQYSFTEHLVTHYAKNVGIVRTESWLVKSDTVTLSMISELISANVGGKRLGKETKQEE